MPGRLTSAPSLPQGARASAKGRGLPLGPAPARVLRRPCNVRPPGRLALSWYVLARAVVAVACRSAWRVRVVGAENIPKASPFILCPVHRSYIDTLLVACIGRRRARFMGHAGVFSRPWVARLFGSLGGFPVRPGPDRAAVRILPGRAGSRRAPPAVPRREALQRPDGGPATPRGSLPCYSGQRPHCPGRYRGQRGLCRSGPNGCISPASP